MMRWNFSMIGVESSLGIMLEAVKMS